MVLNVLHSQRVTGRTTRIVERAGMYESALIVCPDKYRVDFIKKMLFQQFGKKHNVEVTTFETYSKEFRYKGRRFVAVFFDDLDAALSRCCPEAVIDTVSFEDPFSYRVDENQNEKIISVKCFRGGIDTGKIY